MKRVLALLLALAMVFSFAACKSDKAEDETTGESTEANVDGIVDDLTADDITDDTDDAETEAEVDAETDDGFKQTTDSEGNHIITNGPNKKPIKVPANKPTAGVGDNVKPIKPDEEYHPSTPTTHIYKITVKKTDDGKLVTIDGKTYNLRKSEDQRALKQRIKDEQNNDLVGQLYKADPSIAVDLGLITMEGGNVLSYTYNVEGQYFWIDDINSWQQNFGFNPFYDSAAGFTVMYYDTVRLEYNWGGRPWMIQLWKGQYGFLFIGSEIGLYTKYNKKTPTPSTGNPSLNHYDCAVDDLINMEQVLYRADIKGVLNPLFATDFGKHWWSTGFIPGALPNFADRSELVMEARMRFDGHLKGMAKVVGETFKKNGFKEIQKSAHNIYHPDTYYVNGDDVVFVWRYKQHNKYIPIKLPTRPSKPAPETSTKPESSTKAEASTSTVDTTKATSTSAVAD